ncbi:hypothetical protein [Noviherbaspirillum pedocola]|uniref:Uncharacterized protein n=1 Tax=Noviherbaspirillum pedocola TaxID=2801341 RepID=A0A934T3B6_9BURK|nr:hypothetical protein [Noviherbaspirillum pedocola]MBK4738749.1 hypothetical protein [Noviherbaspirillum pedocola]
MTDLRRFRRAMQRGAVAVFALALASAEAASAATHKSYMVAGTNIGVTVTGGGPNPLQIVFTNVTVEIVTSLLQKMRENAVADTSGADVTVGQMTYNCGSSGTCSKLVISKPL